MVTQLAPSLRYLFDGSHDGAFNMAQDESLFRRHIQEEQESLLIRSYHFSEPTSTVGYGMWRHAQSILDGQAIRRLTGGGIVLHTPSDLTYAMMMPIVLHPSLRQVTESYRFLHEILRKSLKAFHLDTELYSNCERRCETKTVSYCFDSPVLYDVMLRGKKIAGAGQKRSMGYLLHQGSIDWKTICTQRVNLTEQEFLLQFVRDLAQEFQIRIVPGT